MNQKYKQILFLILALIAISESYPY